MTQKVPSKPLIVVKHMLLFWTTPLSQEQSTQQGMNETPRPFGKCEELYPGEKHYRLLLILWLFLTAVTTEHLVHAFKWTQDHWLRIDQPCHKQELGVGLLCP